MSQDAHRATLWLSCKCSKHRERSQSFTACLGSVIAGCASRHFDGVVLVQCGSHKREIYYIIVLIYYIFITRAMHSLQMV